MAAALVRSVSLAERVGDLVLLADPAPALSVPGKSHVAAVAWVVRQLGASSAEDTPRTLVATAQVYVEGCGTCAGSGEWNVTTGLSELLAERSHPHRVAQRWRTTNDSSQAATPEDVAQALHNEMPVIATLCYARAAALPAVAVQRGPNSYSVCVLGLLQRDGEAHLIARDGRGEGDVEGVA